MHHDDLRRGGQKRNRRKALERIVRDLCLHKRMYDQVLIGSKQRIPVRCRCGRSPHSNNAASGRQVLDIELATRLIGKLLREHPCDQIVGISRRPGNDDLDGLVRISLACGNRLRRHRRWPQRTIPNVTSDSSLFIATS